ncbi:MAG: phosphate signaling complex protein PhoU [Synergistaceae bacterium]|nr:phosphate signaling complex protein PhoU [Synergistaceae bacterium]
MTELNVRKTQDEALDRIREQLFKLGNLAQDAIRKAVWALEKQDETLSREVLDGDDVLDELASSIEEGCLLYTARYQPVAQDLRTISAINRMAIDLERIGDLGVSIAKITRFFFGKTLIKPLIDIPRMAGLVEEMIDGTLRAFLNRDVEEAKRVCAMDDMLDDLDRQIFNELLLLMIENPRVIEQATQLVLVSRALERAGDHTTNLAEKTIYMITGKQVKASEYRRKREE